MPGDNILTVNVTTNILHHWLDGSFEYAIVEVQVENYTPEISLLMVDHNALT